MTVWRFETPQASNVALRALTLLSAEREGDPSGRWDAATLSWPAGMAAPTTRAVSRDRRGGALQDSFWAVLFTAIFYLPLLDAVLEVSPGPDDSLAIAGIRQRFINDVRDTITPACSALFLVSTQSAVAWLADGMLHAHAAVVAQVELSTVDHAALMAVFSEPTRR